LASEFACDNLLLVLGEYVWQQEVIPAAEQWRIGVNNVKALGKYAQELDLEIAVELEPFQFSLVNTVDTMLRFLDDVEMPDVVRANCDISHLFLMSTEPSEVARLAGRIAHVHLSEQILKTGFDRTVSIELKYPPQPERVVEWVTEAYEGTARMMRELGCRSR
jgi:sugar phosphate isomerase/epimerase